MGHKKRKRVYRYIYNEVEGIEGELKALRKSAKMEQDNSKIVAYNYCINRLAEFLKTINSNK